MAIQKRHRGTLGDFGSMEVSDLSFDAPEPKPAPIAPNPKKEPKPEPTPVPEPAPIQQPQPVVVAEPVAVPIQQPQPAPLEAPVAPVVTPAPTVASVVVPVAAPAPQPAVTPAAVPVAEVAPQPVPRRGRPKGIKGAGPKRLNLIAGDTDKVLALQLPSKLIEGLKRFADDHDITMKELIGKTLMKKIGPEYYNN